MEGDEEGFSFLRAVEDGRGQDGQQQCQLGFWDPLGGERKEEEDLSESAHLVPSILHQPKCLDRVLYATPGSITGRPSRLPCSGAGQAGEEIEGWRLKSGTSQDPPAGQACQNRPSPKKPERWDSIDGRASLPDTPRTRLSRCPQTILNLPRLLNWK